MSLHPRVQPAPRLGGGARLLPLPSPHPPHTGCLRGSEGREGQQGRFLAHSAPATPADEGAGLPRPRRAQGQQSTDAWGRGGSPPLPHRPAPPAGWLQAVPAGSAAGFGPPCPRWKGQGQSPVGAGTALRPGAPSSRCDSGGGQTPRGPASVTRSVPPAGVCSLLGRDPRLALRCPQALGSAGCWVPGLC